ACLAFKPQLGIVLPFVLIAARRWNTVGAAAATVLALSAAASLLFGAGIWHEWLQNAPNARGALEDNLVGFHKMQSLYAGVRVLGGSSALAYVA
ncbi:glycosyltransferase 87 family protein, partial [Acinetobacter baumannii]